MSRTDHARKPRLRGHVATVRVVRLYGNRKAEQSTCSCGQVGPLQSTWVDANNDSRDHHRDVYAQERSA